MWLRWGVLLLSDFMDGKCASHIFSTATTSGSMPSTGKDLSISGRLRLLGFQWAPGSGTLDNTETKIRFINGNAYDASKILLDIHPKGQSYPPMDYYVKVPGTGLLFEDGLYIRDERSVAGQTPGIGFLSVIYSGA